MKRAREPTKSEDAERAGVRGQPLHAAYRGGGRCHSPGMLGGRVEHGQQQGKELYREESVVSPQKMKKIA